MGQGNKAQLQIMENAFVMIIVFIILIMAFVFVVIIQKSDQSKTESEFKQLELMKKTRILNFLPELQCQDNKGLDPDCYDILKIITFKEKASLPEYASYKSQLGYVKITVKRFDPSPTAANPNGIWTDEWVVFDNPKPEMQGSKPAQFFVVLRDIVNTTDYFGVVFLEVYE